MNEEKNLPHSPDAPDSRRLQRILIVDDADDIRLVAKMSLQRVGKFDVLACASGEDAIRQAEAFHPDLLLLDVMMPGLDGPGTLARLRELPALASTPAVFMTAKTQQKEIENLKSVGAIAVISKPFEPMSLARDLAKIWREAIMPETLGHHPIGTLDELDMLQSDYAQSLADKWEQLRLAWDLAKQGDAAAGSRVRQYSHTLAGSGATMGYAKVSRVSGELERLLYLLDDSATDAVMVRELRREVDTLLAELRIATLSPEKNAGRATRARRAGQVSVAVAEPKLIYLVEDDVHLARNLQLQLRLFGFEAETFENPALLEAALQHCRPAAVVMDIMFPDDPLAGTRAIAESLIMRTGSVPVIFMSGRTDMSARLAAVRAGGTDYLVKPIRVVDLIDRLDRLTEAVTEEPYQVAVIDSDIASSERNAAVLRGAGMSVSVLRDPMQVPALLEQSEIELIVLKNELANCSGLEMATVISQMDLAAMRPVLMLADNTLQIARMADDGIFFMPVTEADLPSAVKAWCRRHRAQRKLLTLDGLTGLANHTRILQQLELEVARSQRHGYALSVAMIDVDHFKRVNDSQGHATGDRVLASLGRFLRQRLRKTDFVGRYGGEEFMVLLSETSAERARKRLKILRTEFSAIRHFGPTEAFSVTFSTGIACFPGHTGATELAASADQALYEAKRAGRNRVMLAADIST